MWKECLQLTHKITTNENLHFIQKQMIHLAGYKFGEISIKVYLHVFCDYAWMHCKCTRVWDSSPLQPCVHT